MCPAKIHQALGILCLLHLPLQTDDGHMHKNSLWECIIKPAAAWPPGWICLNAYFDVGINFIFAVEASDFLFAV